MNAGLNHMQQAMQATQERIARTAEKYEGSTDWSYDVAKDDFPANTNKCNKFVYDATTESGASPGKTNGGRWPPTAGQWADPDYKLEDGE